ncbi:MAG TPA: 1,2-phenylacetyl-CoA epoxidase subunit PaaD [Acidimicrobiales bacterium]|nr:1,2-phenylacetyl-CoA epoxidase subunit PaaD [Acidimicrobiales bacterium]
MSRADAPDDPVATVAAARAAAGSVCDPEVPVLTLADLGVLRSVDLAEDGHLVVTLTPTYSGCPAMDAIRADVAQALADAGLTGAEVRMVATPAWTTDWMSEEGKAKLAEAGIAPPGPVDRGPRAQAVALAPRCPRCGARETRVLSPFGATACKALHVCRGCGEPFEGFKAL